MEIALPLSQVSMFLADKSTFHSNLSWITHLLTGKKRPNGFKSHSSVLAYHILSLISPSSLGVVSFSLIASSFQFS